MSTNKKLKILFIVLSLCLIPCYTRAQVAESVIDFGLGQYSTYAITSGEKLYSWGSNRTGELGLGFTSTAVTSPTLVSSISNVISVGGGGSNYNSNVGLACALISNGDLYCMGLSYGNVPTQETNVTNVSSISVGGENSYAFACVITSVNQLYCWGANDKGQLGIGTTSTRETTPTLVEGVPNISSVSAGFNHTCAINDNHDLYCWGNNSYGELGLGSTSPTYYTEPTLVSSLPNVLSVSTSQYITCAITLSNDLYCWGRNNKGQLGIGNTSNYSSPQHVSTLSNVVNVAADTWHSCAVTMGGSLYCWGYANRIGTSSSNNYLPSHVSRLTGVVSVKEGREHTCAMLENGALYCWGENRVGQIGNNTSGSVVTYPVLIFGEPMPTPTKTNTITNTFTITNTTTSTYTPSNTNTPTNTYTFSKTYTPSITNTYNPNDNDGDGVPNYLDKCPGIDDNLTFIYNSSVGGTHELYFSDEPYSVKDDIDGDGIINCKDDCPFDDWWEDDPSWHFGNIDNDNNQKIEKKNFNIKGEGCEQLPIGVKTFTPTYTPSFTSTNTITNTTINTSTSISTNTLIATSTVTNTYTNTFSNTYTKIATPTNTYINTHTFTNSNTSTNTSTNSFTDTFAKTNTVTKTNTATHTNTITSIFSNTFTDTRSSSPTMISTNTNTTTNTHINTFTYSNTFTPTLNVISIVTPQTVLPAPNISKDVKRKTLTINLPKISSGALKENEEGNKETKNVRVKYLIHVRKLKRNGTRDKFYKLGERVLTYQRKNTYKFQNMDKGIYSIRYQVVIIKGKKTKSTKWSDRALVEI